MSTESEPRVCPICRAPVPPEAPQGLCPRCLLLGASLATEAGQRYDAKSPPPAREELVAAFPQLEIMELIGQGGMGFVFKARQPKLDRLVALKILPQSLATDPAFAERFAREARLLARLNHPNIVTIHDFGQANGFFYLVMEYVDGVNLRQAMRGGRFTAEQALAIVPKICDALQFAHNEGILHRDIKPENIMLDAKGRVKIADFGIAKLMGNSANRSARSRSAPEGGTGEARPEGVEGITETGRVLGTPHYMAPEQIETPGRVDHRADIYSLGVVFYEMLTGELPLGRFAPPSQKSTADPRLDDVVIRTLAREPERRTQSAEEVKTQVETICSEGSHARQDGTRASRDATNPAGYAMAAILYGARKYWRWVAGAGVFVALVVFGLVVPLYFDWSGQGKRPEAVVTAWPVPVENQLPGRTVWRWKCSIPADHALVFKVVSYTPDGVPEVVGNLSSSLVVGSNNLHDEVYELALQDGGKLSPDLGNQFRWDRSWRNNGGGGDYGPVWTNKPPDAGAILGLSDGTCHVHEGDSNLFWILMERAGPSPREFRLLELYVSLQAIPKEFLASRKGNNLMDDANWLASLQARKAARDNPVSSKVQAEANEQRSNLTTVTGNEATFSVSANGTAPLTYQWYLGSNTVATSNAPASAETWAPSLGAGEKPNPTRILTEAKELMAKGQYEESLQRYLWCHNHAVQYDPGQAGVRLSFALVDWIELGRRYPKAKVALVEIRDQKTRMLEEGGGYSELFQEVGSINSYLQDDDATYALFQAIRKKDPQLAGQCYYYVESLLVKHGDYQLCLDYMGDPQSRFDLIKQGFDATQRLGTNSTPQNASGLKRSMNNLFVGQAGQLIEILVGSGHKAEAEKIRDEAIAVLNDPRLRTAVEDAEKKVHK